MTDFCKQALYIKPTKLFLKGKGNEETVSYFSNLFGLSAIETRTLIALTNFSFRNRSHNLLTNFSEKLKLSEKDYYDVFEAIKLLERKRFIEFEDTDAIEELYPDIIISKSFKTFMLTGKTLDIDYSDIFSVFEHFSKIIDEHKSKTKKDHIKLITKLDDILEKMHPIPVVSLLKNTCDDNKILLIYLLKELFEGNESEDIDHYLNNIYSEISIKMRLKKDIVNEKLDLIKNGYVEVEAQSGFFRSDFALSLTDKAKEMVGLNFEQSTEFKSSKLVTIKHEEINTTLVFDSVLKTHVDTLTSALEESRLEQLNRTLKDKNLPSGFVCLLYGAPGTGKTATVHEIALKTERNILQVDIAAIRDMFVGESEKNLKKVFEEYKKATKTFKKTPILLFNEADALIGKRIDVSSSVDQMNNSMQNILLEELEKFDGIFFATTNLTDNLDNAFSRRFLYKVEYTTPSKELREKIWKLKIPELNDNIIGILSAFPLSGGQIENIVRKAIVDSVITNKEIIYTDLLELIKQEISFKSGNKVGF